MKVNTNKLINGVIIAVVCLLVGVPAASFYFTKRNTFKRGDNKFNIDKTTDGADSIEYNLKPINEDDFSNLPYYQYKRASDSISFIRSLRNGDCEAGGTDLDFIGAKSGILCDTCSIKWFTSERNNASAHRVYYVKLNGWGIKREDSLSFHVMHNKNYIRKVEYVTPLIRTKAGGRLLHEVDEPVKFRYNRKDQCLLIPVSKTTQQVLSAVLLIIGVSAVVYALYLSACFLKFMVDISKGQPFTAGNVKRLKIIAASLLIYPLATYVINLLIGLIFYSYFSQDVILNWKPWDGSWKLFFFGIIFLALYKAFRQGKTLKEEQDLVV